MMQICCIYSLYAKLDNQIFFHMVLKLNMYVKLKKYYLRRFQNVKIIEKGVIL